MPAAEPHPRRRLAVRRALTIAAVAVLALATPVAAVEEPTDPILPPAQPDPTSTTTTTTIQTTTTAPAQTTTTAPRSTATTAQPRSTSTTTTQVVTRDDVVEDARTVAEDEPAETTSTARDLLVSGDGSEGAQATTTSTTVVEVAADDEGALDEQAQIWLIVAGLVLVALLIGVWTWRYWVRTRPANPDEGPDDTTVFHRG